MSDPDETWSIAGKKFAVSHLDKIYWAEDGLTKGAMLDYYRQMAGTMLPYFVDRPVTLRVFPGGVHGPGYYRRDMPDNAPEWVRSVDYHPETAEHVTQLPLVDDAAG